MKDECEDLLSQRIVRGFSLGVRSPRMCFLSGKSDPYSMSKLHYRVIFM